MRYINNPDVQAPLPAKTGVLLVNLGTPDAPTPKALKRYLKEFLSDPRVVEFPRLLWWFILNGVILQFRPKRSAKSYASVFTEQGSPLLFHTRQQTAALREKLAAQHGDNLVVEFAMRYGNPATSTVLQRMFDQGVTRLLILPMYPQYSGSTSASVFDVIARDFVQRRTLPELRFVARYYNHPAFITAAATRIRKYWQQHGQADRLLFSYHGIPERYSKNGDPYRYECEETSRLIAAELQLAPEQYLTTFQSRFGREEWLKPYTDATLKALPGQGISSVQVFCPGFAADCLETIEEIAVENREYFTKAGGQRYEYISALNAQPEHIDALCQIVNDQLLGWQNNLPLNSLQSSSIVSTEHSGT
ncbi:ferrochelatase [Chromatiaceae bacterium AAb-1]|nr:ferrochelatase [Chromatiaceae bacterium AAb-1]